MKNDKLLHQIAVTFTISICLLISACGLKGDLYIPEEETRPAPTAAEESQDPEAEPDTQAE